MSKIAALIISTLLLAGCSRAVIVDGNEVRLLAISATGQCYEARPHDAVYQSAGPFTEIKCPWETK